MKDQLLIWSFCVLSFIPSVMLLEGKGVNISISRSLTLGIHHCFNMQLSMNVTSPHLFYQSMHASKMVGTPVKGTCHIALNDTWVVWRNKRYYDWLDFLIRFLWVYLDWHGEQHTNMIYRPGIYASLQPSWQVLTMKLQSCPCIIY